MEEEEVLEPEQEEGYEDLSEEDKVILSDKKLKKLRNLKYFRKYNNEQILEWYKKRHGNEIPPEDPTALVGDVAPAPITISPTTTVTFDPEEHKKKYNAYLTKYKKEYSVDMNDTNDAEALRALIRLMIQSERADELIMSEQHANSPDHRTLKGLGDFQRSLQMSINEIQDKLGISRKARKEKQVDDIPQYIRSIQAKAKDFWDRKTVAVKCDKCKIELARYWLNFPDKVEKVNFEVTCDKCDAKISFTD